MKKSLTLLVIVFTQKKIGMLPNFAAWLQEWPILIFYKAYNYNRCAGISLKLLAIPGNISHKKWGRSSGPPHSGQTWYFIGPIWLRDHLRDEWILVSEAKNSFLQPSISSSMNFSYLANTLTDPRFYTLFILKFKKRKLIRQKAHAKDSHVCILSNDKHGKRWSIRVTNSPNT